MSVNSHLTSVAKANIISNPEKERIERSLNTIKARLEKYFGSVICDKFVFGSYSRGTILPREYDENSDVDIMVVFVDNSLTPQTYLNKLKRFAEERYSTSEIFQSSPAVVLELNHIKFELVPAIKRYEWESGYQIPDKASSYSDWISTDPTTFEVSLTEANKANGNWIKPLIRVIKYWNSCQQHPLPSFFLEESIVNKYRRGFVDCQNLEDYFIDFVEGMNVDSAWSKQTQEKVERLKKVVEKVDLLESEDDDSAETELKKVIPATDTINEATQSMSRVASLNEKSVSPFAVSHRQPPHWPMKLNRYVEVRGKWEKRGFRTIDLCGKLHSDPLEKYGDLFYEAVTNTEKPYKVFWQVVNTGNEAASHSCLRGEFNDGDVNYYGLHRKESTSYTGMHWVECFIVKDNVCVARSGEFAINIK